MNNKMINAKPLYVALAQRKEVRRAHLEAQAQQARAKAAGGPPMAPPLGYPTNGPMFYPGPGPMGGQRPGFVYPQQQMVAGPGPRPRWTQGPIPSGPQNPLPQGVVPQGMAGPRPTGPGPMGQPQGYGAQLNMPNMPGRQPGPPRGGSAGRSGPRGPPGAGANKGPQGAGPQGVAQPQGGRGRQDHGAQRNQPNVNFNKNVRNRDATGQPLVASPAGVAVPTPSGHPDQLTVQVLAAAPPDQQKQMIGERLFPLIQQRESNLAGKITGMLLEMDNGELLHLLDSREALGAKIQEALKVLQEHDMAGGDEADGTEEQQS